MIELICNYTHILICLDLIAIAMCPHVVYWHVKMGALEYPTNRAGRAMQTIICMKWGTRYGPEFVNRLYAAIQRYTERPTRLVCFTDDSSGINPDVQTHDIPPLDLPEIHANKPWRKITMWKKDLADLSGDVLFLDLDLVVTGNLDVLFDYKPGHYCVAENWTQMGQGIGNTSCYRFPVGEHSYLYDTLQADSQAMIDKYRISQVYISREISDIHFWPELWCASFKHTLIPKWPLNFFKMPELPEDTRIVAFTGKPDQDEAIRGEWPAPWYKKTYKYVKPTPWILEHWQEKYEL